jgi:hypothetical protein
VISAATFGRRQSLQAAAPDDPARRLCSYEIEFVLLFGRFDFLNVQRWARARHSRVTHFRYEQIVAGAFRG